MKKFKEYLDCVETPESMVKSGKTDDLKKNKFRKKIKPEIKEIKDVDKVQ